jgi:hypothetical protein
MTSEAARLYIWTDGDPSATPPNAAIPDEPGVNDLDQIADAVRDGTLGRYLPVTLKFAEHAEPHPNKVRAVDVAKLLRDRHIRHRRRYEVFVDDRSDETPEEAGRSE